MGFKRDMLGQNIRFGFVMSEGTNQITVFDGQEFINIDDFRSGVHVLASHSNRHYLRVDLLDLIVDKNLIDYYNIMWNMPFYYQDLNR